MAEYRKKPVVVEAEVFRRGMEDGIDFKKPMPDMKGFETNDPHGTVAYPYINTLEGKHYVSPGDYIITGIKGERYPCKPDIFEETYEPVTD